TSRPGAARPGHACGRSYEQPTRVLDFAPQSALALQHKVELKGRTMHERFDTFGPPPARPDPWETTRAEAVPDEDLDPREAATLLEQTTRQARDRFERRPTILILAGAVTVLVAYGAVWLSVRHQHPYAGPTGTALGVLYGTLALWIVLVVAVTRRALRGRSSRQRRLEGIVFAAIWICVYVFQGALHHVDPNPSIAYGVYAAAAPLLVV